MVTSLLKRILIETFTLNGKRILKRDMKPYEIQHFLNVKEERIETIIAEAKHKFEVLVNNHLEDMKK